jgi:hypothetical protein
MDLATSIPVTPSWYSLTAPSGKVIFIIFFGIFTLDAFETFIRSGIAF